MWNKQKGPTNMNKKPEEEKGKKKKKEVVTDGMTISKLKVRLTFQEELLGTANADLNIHAKFIASKGPDAQTLKEEIEALGENAVVEKTMTVFARNADGGPTLWDYQIKGFFKDACGMLSRAKGSKSGALTAYKKIIDGLVFVFPRGLSLIMPEGGEIGLDTALTVDGKKVDIGHCQRPLRAQTALGERIALAHSETVPIGTTVEFEIRAMELAASKVTIDDCIKEWLDYGALRGLGQWRNSGKGRYSYIILP
jgi:hypothetical protein